MLFLNCKNSRNRKIFFFTPSQNPSFARGPLENAVKLHTPFYVEKIYKTLPKVGSRNLGLIRALGCSLWPRAVHFFGGYVREKMYARRFSLLMTPHLEQPYAQFLGSIFPLKNSGLCTAVTFDLLNESILPRRHGIFFSVRARGAEEDMTVHCCTATWLD